MGSSELVLPVEDGDVASGHAEAVDVLQIEGRFGFARSTVPVGQALCPTCLDGGVEIGSFHSVDVNGTELVRLLAEDREGEMFHERR